MKAKNDIDEDFAKWLAFQSLDAIAAYFGPEAEFAAGVLEHWISAGGDKDEKLTKLLMQIQQEIDSIQNQIQAVYTDLKKEFLLEHVTKIQNQINTMNKVINDDITKEERQKRAADLYEAIKDVNDGVAFHMLAIHNNLVGVGVESLIEAVYN